MCGCSHQLRLMPLIFGIEHFYTLKTNQKYVKLAKWPKITFRGPKKVPKVFCTPKTAKMGRFGRFGGTKNGTSGVQIKIQYKLDPKTPKKTPQEPELALKKWFLVFLHFLIFLCHFPFSTLAPFHTQQWFYVRVQHNFQYTIPIAIPLSFGNTWTFPPMAKCIYLKKVGNSENILFSSHCRIFHTLV